MAAALAPGDDGGAALAPYADALVYRASFAFGARRHVELAVALPAFDAASEARTGDAT